MDLTTLRVANSKRQKEWDKDSKTTLLYRAVELGGECGELLNIVKKLERKRIGIRGTRSTAAALEEELADIVICADLLAMHLGIDLGRIVKSKFNKTSRKYKLKTVI